MYAESMHRTGRLSRFAGAVPGITRRILMGGCASLSPPPHPSPPTAAPPSPARGKAFRFVYRYYSAVKQLPVSGLPPHGGRWLAEGQTDEGEKTPPNQKSPFRGTLQMEHTPKRAVGFSLCSAGKLLKCFKNPWPRSGCRRPGHGRRSWCRSKNPASRPAGRRPSGQAPGSGPSRCWALPGHRSRQCTARPG